jgi:hypothetical protein
MTDSATTVSQENNTKPNSTILTPVLLLGAWKSAKLAIMSFALFGGFVLNGLIRRMSPRDYLQFCGGQKSHPWHEIEGVNALSAYCPPNVF